ncbi:4-hydroxyphenylpyruvate dioxygenase [Fimbriimonas ginsengisoli]|uniref:4-hydroxyphenylpyruvate dioxygenase n=1 Tax=Fimbriimonas ginsengisoli Gsoil 348 TaxID=661478 RepID=A0A068NZ78_FIMGI|nr:4-hydroxyphenylpyruvate dioxygenase [Fimbriimonas ginsengisoli]AIE88099.1 4-hydroxyphenylpyruvate dioxygenase [Fimbriimonas ginsengisoli Gsoil 348]
MQDTFPIRRVDHIRHYVNNARQSAYYYQNVFGFDITGYAGLETGRTEQVDYLLEQKDIRVVLSAPVRPGHPMAPLICEHGDFVQDIAFEVEDVDLAFRTALSRGAKPAYEPKSLDDDHGHVRVAGIRTYGDTVHSLINRDHYRGHFMPGFREENQPGDPLGLVEIDHCVGNVELGHMNEWVHWYEDVLGFRNILTFDDKDISTEYTALMSKVMTSGNGRVKFPINEPAEGKKKSQIDEFLEFFGGPGVQHVALRTDNIIETVSRLQARGLEFLRVPHAYYEVLEDRVGKIDENIDELAELGILVDRDDEGYLLQIFSKPVTDRPTLFYEIIHRKGAKSFGKGNFKALFEAIEREQALRGTL